MKTASLWHTASIVFVMMTMNIVESRGTTARLLRGQQRMAREVTREDSLTQRCRLTVFHTVTHLLNGNTTNHEQLSCIPLNADGTETDDVYPIENFPEDLSTMYSDDIHSGRLSVSITEVTKHEDSFVLASTSTVIVTDGDENSRRRLQTAPSPIVGNKTVAIVRVSTIDASPVASVSALRALLSENGVNFKSQYKACSFGQFQWQLAPIGVLDIVVPQSISAFRTGSSLVTAAQDVIRNSGIVSSVGALADRVMFCLAPGTGDWSGNAGINHWRVQLNNDWCLSLSGTSHEFGHTVGLTHSNENGIPYADATGYMASGFTNSTWPKKCFNGHKNYYLGWYRRRTLNFNPVSISAPRLIKVAAFADFNSTFADEPVLVNIGNKYFMQYNRAKGVNLHTNEKADQLTITDGNAQGSDNRAGLSVGGSFDVANFLGSGHTLSVRACSLLTEGTVDIMVVSVGKNGTSACGQRVATRASAPACTQARRLVGMC
jgi:hypothetical protein